MWHFCLWGRRIQIQSNFSISTQLFLLHLPPARVKMWARLSSSGNQVRLAGEVVSSYHMWCQCKKLLTGVYKTFLRFYRNFYSTHIMLKLICQVKDCFQTKLCIFSFACLYKFLFLSMSGLSLQDCYLSYAAVAACNAPQHHQKSLQLDRYIRRQSGLLQ